MCNVTIVNRPRLANFSCDCLRPHQTYSNCHLYTFVMSGLPSLPASPLDTPWSANVHLAYQVIADMTTHANQGLQQGESDLMRIRFHLEMVVGTAIPILQALEASGGNEGIPTAWLHLCAERLGELVLNLRKVKEGAEGQ